MFEANVKAQIESAFAHTPSPGDRFEDISATQWDEGIVDYFRGKSWHGHSAQDLRYHEAALSFFTDKAFRYWLPAFMLAELQDPETADVIAEGIAYQLTCHWTTSAMTIGRLQQFTKVELEAIVAFFEECSERYDDKAFSDAAKSVRCHIAEVYADPSNKSS